MADKTNPPPVSYEMINDILATKFEISSLFAVQREGHKHSGLDVTSVEGKVFSTVNGIVLYDRDSDTFGFWIGIYDPNEDKLHRYGHMKTRSVYDIGNEVSVGDFIGFIGSTGRSTGPHIHYDIVLCKGRDPKTLNFAKMSVEKGDYEDPAIYLGIEAVVGRKYSILKKVDFITGESYKMNYDIKRV